ncbi:hypothetical protein LJB62_00080 [Bacillus sp. DFI.2.34]|nr:hypothetical protein [Bacillus sp. DFI.2.34]
MTTRPFLVTTLSRKLLVFDDETLSRHHFGAEIAPFWRRNSFSSPFWGGKLTFLTTRPFLVTILGRKTPFFGDETLPRHHFEPKIARFWRRGPFSSSFFGRKLYFLATRPLLVVFLKHENYFFWRRNSFSSPFWG